MLSSSSSPLLFFNGKKVISYVCPFCFLIGCNTVSVRAVSSLSPSYAPITIRWRCAFFFFFFFDSANDAHKRTVWTDMRWCRTSIASRHIIVCQRCGCCCCQVGLCGGIVVGVAVAVVVSTTADGLLSSYSPFILCYSVSFTLRNDVSLSLQLTFAV